MHRINSEGKDWQHPQALFPSDVIKQAHTPPTSEKKKKKKKKAIK